MLSTNKPQLLHPPPGPPMNDGLWSVILAAGKGRRLADVTGGTPKQFWRSDGRPSLLEQTFDRVCPLAPSERTTVVIDRTHQCYVPHPRTSGWPADWVLYQPEDKGTAAGLLLALGPALEGARDPIVMITPSDHGVVDATGFRASIQEAAATVRSGRIDAILFGVEPSEALSDYGWITPGREYLWAPRLPLREVLGFVEKPPKDVATNLFVRHALWNTMVIVARAEAVIGWYERHLPDVARVFDLHRKLRPQERHEFLTSSYASLPPADFSRDVLSRTRDMAVYSWRRSMGWSDLGTPERLSRWLYEDARSA